MADQHSRKKRKRNDNDDDENGNAFVYGEPLPPMQGVFHFGGFVDYDKARVVFTLEDIPPELQDYNSEKWNDKQLLKDTFKHFKGTFATTNTTTAAAVAGGKTTTVAPKFQKSKHILPTCLILEATTMHDRLCVLNWWQNLSFEKQKEIIRQELPMKYLRYTVSAEPLVLPPEQELQNRIHAVVQHNSASFAADRQFMKRCIELAVEARDKGNTPVGCVLVREDEIIAEASESLPASPDIVGHAEVLAIRAACWALQTTTLPRDCTLYCTAEPCWMCSHAIRQASIGRVVFGTTTPYMGGCTSRYPILRDRMQVPIWSAPPDITPGVMEEECRKLLRRR